MWKRVASIWIALLCLGAQAQAASVLVGGPFPPEIYEVELGTGVVLGSFPAHDPVSGLALSGSSVFAATPFAPEIVELELTSGLPIGFTPTPFPVGGLDVAADGSLWIGGPGASELFNIQVGTGAILDIVPVFFPPHDLSGLALDASTGFFAVGDASTPKVFILDELGLPVFDFPTPNLIPVGGLTFTDTGTLLVGAGHDIFEVDPLSGIAVGVTHSPVEVQGLAFVPEPSTALLLASGLVGLAARRRHSN